MLDRIWVGNIIGFITSNDRLAIYNRNNNCCGWTYVACLLEKRMEYIYDNSSKKSSKILKGICEINI